MHLSGNYDANKASYVSGLSLDPAIASALSDFIRQDRDGSNTHLSVTQEIVSPEQLPSVIALTDVMTFNLPAPGPVTIDLADLKTGVTSDLDFLNFGDRDNDADINLLLRSFRGIVLLGDGNNSVTASERVGIQSGSGNDTITTGVGGDTVVSGAGNDLISTNGDNDRVFAGPGDDSVHTGAGNDTVYTGTGSDSIRLASGDDRVYVEGASGDVVTVDGGVGTDRLDLTANTVTNVEALLSGSTTIGLSVTLATGGVDAVVHVYNFEQFVYDNGGGPIVVVGAAEFDNLF